MANESDFREGNGRSIDEIAAALHEQVDKEVADGERSEEDAADEHEDIDAIAARLLDAAPSRDPEDPSDDED